MGHGKVLGFACDGCRGRRGRTEHKFPDWREVNNGPAVCLHLSNQKRYKMYTKLEKFIRYKVIPKLL